MSTILRDDAAARIPDQARLRQKIKALKGLQERRILAVAQMKADLDATLEREQRRIDNLEKQLTIGVAR